MYNLGTWFTQSSTQCTAIKAYKFSFSLLTALASLLIKGRIVFTKFVSNLFLLSLHLLIVHFTVLLVGPYLLDVGIYDEIYGPSQHLLNRVHL